MLSIRETSTNYNFYRYEPSMAAAVIFIFLFGLSSILHLIQMGLTRTWFMIPFVIGGFFELVGFIGRAISASQNPGPYTLFPFIMQSILLLVAPALLAASIYMELARIAIMVDGERALLIRRIWLTKVFVAGDVFSFLMQTFGAGMLAGHNSSSIKTGNTVIICGLVLQVAFFGFFIVASAVFHHRIRARPTNRCMIVPWEKHMVSLYIVSILIFVRSIIRVAEYVQGHEGFIMSHEAFLYLFDALVMWLAMCIMSWIHPSEVAALLHGGKAFTKAWKMESVEHTSSGYMPAEGYR